MIDDTLKEAFHLMDAHQRERGDKPLHPLTAAANIAIHLNELHRTIRRGCSMGLKVTKTKTGAWQMDDNKGRKVIERKKFEDCWAHGVPMYEGKPAPTHTWYWS